MQVRIKVRIKLPVSLIVSDVARRRLDTDGNRSCDIKTEHIGAAIVGLGRVCSKMCATSDLGLLGPIIERGAISRNAFLDRP